MSLIVSFIERVIIPPFVWVTAPVVRGVKALVARHVLEPIHAALRRRVEALPEPPMWVAPLVTVLGVLFTVIVTILAGQRQDDQQSSRRAGRGDRVDEDERQRQRDDQRDDQGGEDEGNDDLGEALEMLEVEYPPAPDRDEVKAAYREKAVETHPDQGGDARKFIRVRSAWETVRDRVS